MVPCCITRYYTDYWGADERHLARDEHCPGKRKKLLKKSHLGHAAHHQTGHRRVDQGFTALAQALILFSEPAALPNHARVRSTTHLPGRT